MNNEPLRVCIGCTDRKTGAFGSFIGTNCQRMIPHYEAISPVFGSSFQLFDWMNTNGWSEKRDEQGLHYAIPPTA